MSAIRSVSKPRTKTVLGVDAAWTTTQPSGVALVQRTGSRWNCLAVAPSYASFVTISQGQPVDWREKPSATTPNVDALMTAAIGLAGRNPDVVAIDMPLSTRTITGRRAADQRISEEFGGRHCSTHSPHPERPGRMGAALQQGFEKHGYSLACADQELPVRSSLLEVYPHTALLRLVRARERVPYKATKTTTYWKGEPLAVRRTKLVEEWRRILAALKRDISGITLELPIPDEDTKFAGLKRFEDALDALICCWLGIQYLGGDAKAYGDKTAAIWT